tara:strand:- start:102 stop:491 length:390 start_codon:yes stop_codon:yes gene_type:complete
MDLEEFTYFISEKKEELRKVIENKKKEFKTVVGEEAKKLKLSDIIGEIQFDAGDFIAYDDKDWKYGKNLKLFMCQCSYTVVLSENSLILIGSYDIELVRFTGNEVRDYYKTLSAAVLVAQKEELDNMPF